MATKSDRRILNQANDEGLHSEATLELTEENCVSIDVDDIWHYLGKYGRYQVISILLLALSMWPQSVSILSGVFVGMSVNHKCHSDVATKLQMSDFLNGSQVVLSECSVQVITNTSTGSQVLYTEECLQFEYDSETPTSYLAEWDLVCDREALGQLPQVLTMVGMMIGAMTLPQVGDRFGRRTLGIVAHVCHLLVSLGLAYAPAFELFLLLKFLSGAFNQGFMVTGFIMFMELLPTELRTFMSLMATMIWVFCILSLVPFAYVFMGSHWRTLQLAYGLISLALIGLLFMDESLRWLLANKKVKRAEAVLKKACKFNGKSYEKLLQTVLREDIVSISEKTHQRYEQSIQNEAITKDLHSEVNKKTSETKMTFMDVLRNSTMRTISCIVCYSWMVNSLTYYGITLLSTSLAGNPYVNFLIGGLLEIPSTIVMFFLLTRFGRKIVTIWFLGVAGVSLLVVVLLATLTENSPTLALIQTGLTLFGKFCISASFNIMWLYTPELYPTNLRSVGTGMSSMGARIAASASPFFSILARKAIWAPGALFSAACFLCVFLLTFLPETKYRELPTTIAEVEGWYRSDRQSNTGGIFKRVKAPKDENDKDNRVV